MKKLPSILLVGVLCLTGCVRHSPNLSYDSLSASHQSRQATELAQAIAGRIGQRYPGQSVHIAKADTGVFGDALEYALTQTGSLGTEDTAAVSLTYAMGEMDGSGYLHVRFSDGNSMAQSFQVAAPELTVSDSITPMSPPVNPVASPIEVTPLPPASPAPVASVHSVKTVKGTPTKLSSGVLSSLPSNWRYTIPDSSRRSLQVFKPHLPWRDCIQSMAEQAGCAASFDESARRVTIITYDDAPLPSASAVAVSAIPTTESIAPVSPQSLPNTSPVVSAALANVVDATAPAKVPAYDTLTLSEVPLSATTAPTSTVPAATLSAIPSPPVAEEWTLMPGSLADQLSSWCTRSGWTLIWKADSDVRLHVHAIMRGSFEKVVGDVFKGLSVQGNSLRATLYHGNNVLEVREN